MAVPLSHHYFETGWKLCYSRVLYSMKSLHREVFEPILRVTGCTSIFCATIPKVDYYTRRLHTYSNTYGSATNFLAFASSP